jgi:sec-independent protein translocase protein TatB
MASLGWLEMGVIAVIAVLVFGPERLPRLISQAAQWMRVVRDQATSARDDLMAAADIDPEMTGELRKSVADLADLHPRRMAASLMSDVTAPFTEAAGTAKAAGTMGNGSKAGGVDKAANADPSSTAGPATAYDTDAT